MPASSPDPRFVAKVQGAAPGHGVTDAGVSRRPLPRQQPPQHPQIVEDPSCRLELAGEVLDVISAPGLERMARFLANFVTAAARATRAELNP